MLFVLVVDGLKGKGLNLRAHFLIDYNVCVGGWLWLLLLCYLQKK
jgi:hypothetical protein